MATPLGQKHLLSIWIAPANFISMLFSVISCMYEMGAPCCCLCGSGGCSRHTGPPTGRFPLTTWRFAQIVRDARPLQMTRFEPLPVPMRVDEDPSGVANVLERHVLRELRSEAETSAADQMAGAGTLSMQGCFFVRRQRPAYSLRGFLWVHVGAWWVSLGVCAHTQESGGGKSYGTT